MDKFTVLDWVIIAIVIVSTLISIKRGFFKEAFSLVTWLAAFAIGFLFADTLATYLVSLSESPSVRKMIAMAILFVMTLIAGGLIRLLVEQLISFTGLSGTDRLLGMVFGALRGLLVVIVVFMLAKKILPIEQESWWQASQLAPQVIKLEVWTVEKAAVLKDRVMPLLQQIGI